MLRAGNLHATKQPPTGGGRRWGKEPIMNQDLEKDIAPQAAGESETNAPPESMALTETSPPPKKKAAWYATGMRT